MNRPISKAFIIIHHCGHELIPQYQAVKWNLLVCGMLQTLIQICMKLKF